MLELERKVDYRARVLFAVGLKNSSVVLATDSEWVASDIEYISDGAEDIGCYGWSSADDRLAPGIYLWEGILKTSVSNTMDGYDVETDYVGEVRSVGPPEVKDLLEMRPPDEVFVTEEVDSEVKEFEEWKDDLKIIIRRAT
jgi:hypothetical protein